MNKTLRHHSHNKKNTLRRKMNSKSNIKSNTKQKTLRKIIQKNKTFKSKSKPNNILKSKSNNILKSNPIKIKKKKKKKNKNIKKNNVFRKELFPKYNMYGGHKMNSTNFIQYHRLSI